MTHKRIKKDVLVNMCEIRKLAEMDAIFIEETERQFIQKRNPRTGRGQEISKRQQWKQNHK